MINFRSFLHYRHELQFPHVGSRARPKFNSRFPEEEHKKVHVHNLSLQEDLIRNKDVITKYMQIKYFCQT